MAIIRRGDHVYYYRSVRRGSKVTSEYVASGDRALMIATLDEYDRQERRDHDRMMRKRERRLAEWLAGEKRRLAEKKLALRRELEEKKRALRERLREEWTGFRREMAEAEAPIIALCERVEVEFKDCMNAAGFKQHERGAWRKRRKGKAMSEATGVRQAERAQQIQAAALPPPSGSAGDALADLDRKIVHALEQLTEGDQALATRIHDQIETDPDGIVEMFGGDPAKQIFDALYRRAGPSPGIWFATAFRVVQLRGELGGPDPSSLERMLIERVLICWLDVNLNDREAESDRADDAAAGAYNVRLGEFLDRRRDRAHKRFNAAVKTLATARRLAVPGLQLNVTQSVDVKVEREGAGSASEAKDGGGIAELLAGRGMAGARN